MIAQNVIKFNGKWYNAGEEVPENNNSGASFDYSKTAINRMSTCNHLPQNKA